MFALGRQARSAFAVQEHVCSNRLLTADICRLSLKVRGRTSAIMIRVRRAMFRRTDLSSVHCQPRIATRDKE